MSIMVRVMLTRINSRFKVHISEAAIQRCSQENVFWKYAANLNENTLAEVLL